MDEKLKQELQKIIDEKKQKRQELINKSNDTNIKVEELRNILNEIEQLNADLDKLIKLQEPADAREKEDNPNLDNFDPTKVYLQSQRNTNTDIFDDLEYRNAFKDFVVSGTPIPNKYKEAIKKRADELTMVGDISAVIPTTLQNKVIQDMTTQGKILDRITTTSFQGAVEIPLADINLNAKWLESEDVVSDTQKAEMNAKLSFSYHVLESRVAIGLLTSTVSLPLFESTVVNQLKISMIKALEDAVVRGSGSGQPLGFLNYDLPTEQIVQMTQSEMGTVKAWAGVEAIIPPEVESNVIYIMAKPTWEKYLNGMTSTTGQKIGLGKISEKGTKILNGREVLTVNNLPSFDSASAGDTFAVVIDLSKYYLNSNLAMYYKKYFDDDKNKWIHKSLMIADGKMAIGEVGTGASKKLVGAQGLIYIKKGA